MSVAEKAMRARERAETLPLDQFDVSEPSLWRDDTHWPYFERMRREDPVHYCSGGKNGPYWSITKYDDILAVDTNHKQFSSEMAKGRITIVDQHEDLSVPMFIAMDPPKHPEKRRAVSGAVSPANLRLLEPLIRERAGRILDNLPRGETFDWVRHVSAELTAQMLATLFDFPFEERGKLTYWSDVITTDPMPGELVESNEEKIPIVMECLAVFTELWNQRVNAPPAGDFISMMAHNPATRSMSPEEFLGNLTLLIVGGNDTTRNSISGSLYALNRYPDQYRKLRENPGLIPSMVNETIRWQSPISHMRRTAAADVEMRGKLIRKGDKVIMWYVSGNRDEDVMSNPNDFIIDAKRDRGHISFGFGIHRCMGNRLAEMQLRIVWEEILRRFPSIELVGEPEFLANPFVKGYASMPVRIPN